eukprot:9486012-Pyramimonas_sp.AAC.2
MQLDRARDGCWRRALQATSEVLPWSCLPLICGRGAGGSLLYRELLGLGGNSVRSEELNRGLGLEGSALPFCRDCYWRESATDERAHDDAPEMRGTNAGYGGYAACGEYPAGSPVAVKVMAYDMYTRAACCDVLIEMSNMRQMGVSGKHQNVVGLIGTCITDKHCYLVMEVSPHAMVQKSSARLDGLLTTRRDVRVLAIVGTRHASEIVHETSTSPPHQSA